MLRKWFAAAAVAAGCGLGGVATAGDDAVNLGRFQPPAGGFGGAVRSATGTAAVDPTDDTELVRGGGHGGGFHGGGFHGGYGGYRGGYYGGYRGGYYGGYRGYYGGYGYRGWGYGGYGYGYRPGFYLGIGLGGYGYGYGGYGYGGYGYGGYGYGYPSYYGGYVSTGYPGSYAGYSLCSNTVPAQPAGSTVLIASASSYQPAAATVAAMPAVITPPSFRYDGGPASPIPQPTLTGQPAANPAQPAAPARETDSVPISLKAANKPVFKYPAYGDKK